MGEASAPGFFGKLPAFGDFVARGLPEAFVEPWDAWLQGALTGSRDRLRETWLNTYLASPFWRFALAPGVCGREAWLGVLMPSVDRVGRYFPFTLAQSLAVGGDPFSLAAGAADWLAAAEDRLLGLLEWDDLDFERLCAELGALPELPAVAPAGAEPGAGRSLAAVWRRDLSAVSSLGEVYGPLLDQVGRAMLGGYSLWWTAGSGVVRPHLRVVAGLPDGATYTAMLAGDDAACRGANGCAGADPAEAAGGGR